MSRLTFELLAVRYALSREITDLRIVRDLTYLFFVANLEYARMHGEPRKVVDSPDWPSKKIGVDAENIVVYYDSNSSVFPLDTFDTEERDAYLLPLTLRAIWALKNRRGLDFFDPDSLKGWGGLPRGDSPILTGLKNCPEPAILARARDAA